MFHKRGPGGRKQYAWTKDSAVTFVAHFGIRSGGPLRTEPVAAAQSQAEDSEPSADAGGSSSARLNSSTLNSTLIDPVEAGDTGTLSDADFRRCDLQRAGG